MGKIQKKVKRTLWPRELKKIQKLVAQLLEKVPGDVAFRSFMRNRLCNPELFAHVHDGIDELWVVTVLVVMCSDGLVGVGVECRGFECIIDIDGNDMDDDLCERCVKKSVTVCEDGDGSWNEDVVFLASHNVADYIATVISVEAWMYRSYDEIERRSLLSVNEIVGLASAKEAA